MAAAGAAGVVVDAMEDVGLRASHRLKMIHQHIPITMKHSGTIIPYIKPVRQSTGVVGALHGRQQCPLVFSKHGHVQPELFIAEESMNDLLKHRCPLLHSPLLAGTERRPAQRARRIFHLAFQRLPPLPYAGDVK